jgi:hypothetical protein
MRNLQILWDYPILTTQQSPINAPPLSLPKQLLPLPDLHQITIRFKPLRDGLGFLERKSNVCDAETTQPPSTLVVCLHSYCVVEDAVAFSKWCLKGAIDGVFSVVVAFAVVVDFSLAVEE